MALEDMLGMGGGPEGGEEPMEEGMGLEIEVGAEESPESGSLEDAVKKLIEDWQPTTPEGEKYLAELEGALADHGMGGLEPEMEEAEGEIVEGAEEDEADEEPPEEGGPTMGFDIVAMRKRAAKNALGGE
tara:strand:+ start:251 stop:640 length:390 start_codon:yes stop_codon:yes gene_type:complete